MELASFLENVNFNTTKPAVSLLLETDFSKEIRIVFKKGQIMKDHKAPFSIVVQVVKGQIDFGVEDRVHQLNEGDLISLKANVPHNLSATSESVVRLTLSKSDSLQRVKDV